MHISTAAIYITYNPIQHKQIPRAHDAITTSLLRQNDVATSFWRNNDVVIASCARWDTVSCRVIPLYHGFLRKHSVDSPCSAHQGKNRQSHSVQSPLLHYVCKYGAATRPRCASDSWRQSICNVNVIHVSYNPRAMWDYCFVKICQPSFAKKMYTPNWHGIRITDIFKYLSCMLITPLEMHIVRYLG